MSLLAGSVGQEKPRPSVHVLLGHRGWGISMIHGVLLPGGGLVAVDDNNDMAVTM